MLSSHTTPSEGSRPSVLDSQLPKTRADRLKWIIPLAIVVLLLASVFFGTQRVEALQGRALDGVTVGGIDVSGMTTEEIAGAVSNVFESRLKGEAVSIYASEDALETDEANMLDDEWSSLEDVYNQNASWIVNATELEANIDYIGIAKQAVEAGRNSLLDDMGIGSRDIDIPVTVNFNHQMVETIAAQIDYAIGEPYLDYGITVNGSVAEVTEGYDGTMVDRKAFSEKLSNCFTSENPADRALVAEVVYTPVRIDRETAQRAADMVNQGVADGIEFDYQGTKWSMTPEELAHWVTSEVMEDGNGGYKLQPLINAAQAKSALLVKADAAFAEGRARVHFEKKDGSIVVHITGTDEVPMVGAAVDQMNKVLFGDCSEGKPLADHERSAGTPTVEIGKSGVSHSMSFDDALHYGIITQVSQFTTEYAPGAVDRNHNIHLAADLIDNSITPGEGGVWSFNEVAGDCNEEKGFRSAGAIANTESVDEIGGGICQVATTVFNAAYLAGYEIIERTNHSVYIPSYPAGRDAAVSWPSLDLKWSNDTNSDILLDTEYTDSTITVTLYGIDPGYTVETETGEVTEGAKAQTRYEYDPNLAAGTSYTKQMGSDGHYIHVTRTVYDTDGEVVRQSRFDSNYAATDTVIVQGATG